VLCRIFGTMAATAKTQPGKAIVIVNFAKGSPEKLKASAIAEAERSGWPAPLFLATSKDDPGQRVTAEALRLGATVILAAGGDGTVRAVAEAMRGSSVPLAIVPSGTGNLLARNLELPLANIDEAVRIAFHGEDRVIDVGVVSLGRESGEFDDHAFLVMAGLGLDARLIANTNPRLKKTVGWLAYVDAGLRALPKVKPMRLDFGLDDEPVRSITVHTIILGNCGTLQGGMVLIPDAKVDDGLIDVVVLRPRGPFGWLRVWNIVSWQNGVLRKSVLGRKVIQVTPAIKDVRYLRGTKVTLSPEVQQHVQLDGDELGRVASLRSWVEPAALIVKVPAQ
jgi:diacylglycerol kinase (ATP)